MRAGRVRTGRFLCRTVRINDGQTTKSAGASAETTEDLLRRSAQTGILPRRRDRDRVLWSKKSLASGVPMATVLFPATAVGLTVLPLMLFQQIQLMVCAWMARRYANRRARTAEQRVIRIVLDVAV
ncbi:hypothetical protein A4R44_03474 [Amycolatopsis sp. M39]|uniref:SBF-like CPA transporter family n=1 Tax=Amycolatopsis rubida TaxID=112413 RepID=A0A1I5HQ05_9PSEU|nr:hypothetical protein A4R44_03474 [Amycolatopsis sp. M39]SFO50343.1 SBF-like CPA transporter family [Amycolatopsis rubida]